jgi:release factor glutamine methyltransferase
MTDTKVWKVIDIINWGKDYLSQRNIPEARLNIEFLLCKVINCKRFDLYLNFDKPLTQDELSEFKNLLKRRLNSEPLQYILGEIEFMGLRFKLTPDVLIPRPETEILVEECINYCKKNFAGYDKIAILDIGTGSGNIAVSLAKSLQNSFITAVDLNDDILRIASENMTINGVEDRIKMEVYDIIYCELPLESNFDVIISNPPYINLSEYEKLQPEIINYEPKTALTDSGDGLTFYKRISSVAKAYLNKDGLLALEIAYNQGDSVSKLLSDAGYKNIIVKKDYSNLDRVIMANL